MYPRWLQSSDFGIRLGCISNSDGGIVIGDRFGRTNIQGVYAAGDASSIGSLVIAAAEGSQAAWGVNVDLTLKEFLR